MSWIVTRKTIRFQSKSIKNELKVLFCPYSVGSSSCIVTTKRKQRFVTLLWNHCQTNRLRVADWELPNWQPTVSESKKRGIKIEITLTLEMRKFQQIFHWIESSKLPSYIAENLAKTNKEMTESLKRYAWNREWIRSGWFKQIIRMMA